MGPLGGRRDHRAHGAMPRFTLVAAPQWGRATPGRRVGASGHGRSLHPPSSRVLTRPGPARLPLLLPPSSPSLLRAFTGGQVASGLAALCPCPPRPRLARRDALLEPVPLLQVPARVGLGHPASKFPIFAGLGNPILEFPIFVGLGNPGFVLVGLCGCVPSTAFAGLAACGSGRRAAAGDRGGGPLPHCVSLRQAGGPFPRVTVAACALGCGLPGL